VYKNKHAALIDDKDWVHSWSFMSRRQGQKL